MIGGLVARLPLLCHTKDGIWGLDRNGGVRIVKKYNGVPIITLQDCWRPVHVGWGVRARLCVVVGLIWQEGRSVGCRFRDILAAGSKSARFDFRLAGYFNYLGPGWIRITATRPVRTRVMLR